MNIPDAIAAARRDVEDANGEPCIEATEAIDRLARLGPLSVGLAEALQAHKAKEYMLQVPWERDHECEWCAACVARLWAMTVAALAAWADAQDGSQPAQEPAGGA